MYLFKNEIKFNKKKQKKTKILLNQKSFKNPNILDAELVFMEHPKTSHKLSGAIRQAEKVSQVGSHRSLDNDTKKCKFLKRKKCENSKASKFF